MDKNNRAYLILGPESSGTRLMAKILIKAGCLGTDDHVQSFDTEDLPEPTQPIVWRRSVPHGEDWINIANMVYRMEEAGYCVTIIITNRDWYAMGLSQVRQGHANTFDTAIKNIERAERFIYSNIFSVGVPFLGMSFESLIRLEAINCNLGLLGLPNLSEEQIKELELFDANSKWFNKEENNED